MTNLRAPVLCLVTDRRRLAARTGASDAVAALEAQISGAIRGGVHAVQIREPDLDSRTLLDLTRRVLDLRGPEAVRIVVNDRIDVALAAGADGVHLREASAPPRRVRALVPPRFLIGRSVHSQEEARRSEGADYLIAGPLFSTPSKPGHPSPLGGQGLQAIVEAANHTPVIAIGGVVLGSVGDVLMAGAGGMAAIGAFIPAAPVADLSRAVQILTEALRFAFDSQEYVP